jgi:tRNA-modifying protein YgfZ
MTAHPPDTTAAHTVAGVAPLPHLGVIRAEGEEAARFLHSQFTQDFSLLGTGEARLAAFCSAKGRMLASFIGFKRAPDDILLVCSADLLASTLKRLQMFVLRAKVRLSDASTAFDLRGLAGAVVPAALPATPWARHDMEGAHLVRLYPGAGAPRALWVAAAGTPPPAGEALPPHLWRWLDTQSGVATLEQKVVDAFVPQMLNFESVGGVNFKKGCYPGQEVVARSQFRGTLKRRAFLLACDHPMAAGQSVFQTDDATQPCGMVAQAAAGPDGRWHAIASLQIASASAGVLHLDAADGPRLALQPLPYELLADI